MISGAGDRDLFDARVSDIGREPPPTLWQAVRGLAGRAPVTHVALDRRAAAGEEVWALLAVADAALIGVAARRTDHTVAPWPPAEAVDEVVLWAAPVAGVRKIVGGHLFLGERVVRIPDDPRGAPALTDFVFEQLATVLSPTRLRRRPAHESGLSA